LEIPRTQELNRPAFSGDSVWSLRESRSDSHHSLGDVRGDVCGRQSLRRLDDLSGVATATLTQGRFNYSTPRSLGIAPLSFPSLPMMNHASSRSSLLSPKTIKRVPLENEMVRSHAGGQVVAKVAVWPSSADNDSAIVPPAPPLVFQSQIISASVCSRHGERTVKCRNPWGSARPSEADGSDSSPKSRLRMDPCGFLARVHRSPTMSATRASGSNVCMTRRPLLWRIFEVLGLLRQLSGDLSDFYNCKLLPRDLVV
jgi:hypothetical protein